MGILVRGSIPQTVRGASIHQSSGIHIGKTTQHRTDTGRVYWLQHTNAVGIRLTRLIRYICLFTRSTGRGFDLHLPSLRFPALRCGRRAFRPFVWWRICLGFRLYLTTTGKGRCRSRFRSWTIALSHGVSYSTTIEAFVIRRRQCGMRMTAATPIPTSTRRHKESTYTAVIQRAGRGPRLSFGWCFHLRLIRWELLGCILLATRGP